MEWQPIETMPNDRVSVLVYCEGSESIGIAHKSYKGKIFMPEPQAIGYDCLTHWMPLPPPPNKSATSPA